MNVLSVFDGMSCGRIALERLGVNVDTYYASEIDKHAIKVSEDNYPDIVRLGDVTKWREWNIDFASIDLLIGGSPCQGFSMMGKRLNLDDERSKLVITFVDIWENIKLWNPNASLLLENVKMNKASKDYISNRLGFEPIAINSALVSGQSRNRLYWTDLETEQPEDKNILLTDILEEGTPEDSVLTDGRLRWLLSDKGQATLSKRYAVLDPVKAQCLTARSDCSWNSNYVTRNGQITRLTPVEYERLQGVPDNFTSAASNAQRYKMLGNGWNVDTICHLLKTI